MTSWSGGVGRTLLVVVEDDGEGRLQPAVELAEEAPREDASRSARYSGVRSGQRPPAAGRGQPQVVEERRDICVALVHLIPEPAEPARREVARDQRRLAGARWRPHPGDRPSPGMIQPAEEPGPRYGARQRGAIVLASAMTSIRSYDSRPPPAAICPTRGRPEPAPRPSARPRGSRKPRSQVLSQLTAANLSDQDRSGVVDAILTSGHDVSVDALVRFGGKTAISRALAALASSEIQFSWQWRSALYSA